MSTSTLPIFRLPSLITEGILNHLGAFELFSLSTLSARSKRVVKAYSSRRHFNVLMKIDEDCVLSLRELRSEDPKMKIYFIREAEAEKREADNGVVFHPSIHKAQFFCKDVSDVLLRMLEHLSTFFNISLIDLVFKMKNEKIMRKINSVVERLKLKIDDYSDIKNEYSYEEVENLMGSESIYLNYPKLTDIHLRRLFKKCIDRPEPIHATFLNVGSPNLFTKMIRMVKDKPKIFTFSSGGGFELTQDDGRFIAVTVVRPLVQIRVSAKK